MTVLEAIAKIHDVFSTWRELGTKKLSNGTELIGHQCVDGEDLWMHAVFPKLGIEAVATLESELGTGLPVDLRTFYRTCGGMVLFGGVFRVLGAVRRRGAISENGPEVDDIVEFNRGLQGQDWMVPGAVAFAVNLWDSTIYVSGLAKGTEVVRVDRASGEILERSPDVWSVIADKLYRLDELFVR